MKTEKRSFYLDILRVIAICSVVFCHSVESYYYIFQDRMILWQNISLISKIFDVIGITLGRIGVPLFLFLTGILISKKSFDNPNEDIPKFYKHNVFSLFITLEIWVIIWNLFSILLFHWRNEISSITLSTILQNIFLLKTVDYILPAWYAPMILGVYLFMPYVSIILKKINFKTISIPLIASVIMFFVLPSTNAILQLFNYNISSNLDLSYSGGIYGVYMLLGYFIDRGILKKIPTIPMILVCIISLISCSVFQFILNYNGIFYKLSYDNIFLLISCCALFEILKRLFKKPLKCQKLITYISKTSFAIFLVHNIIQYVIYQSGLLSNIIRPLAVTIMFIITMIISMAIIKVLSRVPIAKKYLLKM